MYACCVFGLFLIAIKIRYRDFECIKYINIILSVLKVKRKSVHQSNRTLTDIQLARSAARANRVKSEAESRG